MEKGDADECIDATLEVILLTEKLNFASIDGEANADDWYLQMVVLVRLEGSTTYSRVLRDRNYRLMPGLMFQYTAFRWRTCRVNKSIGKVEA